MANDIKTSPLIADAISGYGDITKAIAQTVPTEGFIGQGRLANARNAALGTIDVPAFLAKFPEFKTDYDKEQAEGMISVRKKNQGDLGSMTIEAFMNLAQEEISQLTYEK